MNQQTQRDSALGIAGAAGAFAIWGILPAFWKQLQHVATIEVTAHRALWTLVLAVVVTIACRRGRSIRRVASSPAIWVRLVASAAMLGLNWGIFIWAVGAGYILDASLGYFINPLVSVLLGRVVLGERLRRLQTISVLLALAGVLNLVIGYGHVPWIAMVLAVSFALYGLIRKTTDVEPVEGLTLEMGILAIPAVILLAIGYPDSGNAMLDGTWATRALLAATGVVTVAPLLLFGFAVKRVRLSTVGFCQYIAPSCMFAQAVLLYGEDFSDHHTVTFAMIWAALAIYSYDAIRRR